MKEERFKNIIKINWFIYKWKEYNRNDWIQILCHKDEWYTIVYWDWYTFDVDNKSELIWYLALNGIINRLF